MLITTIRRIMDNTEREQNMEKYVGTEEFQRNLENQREVFDSLSREMREKHYERDGFPFSSWSEFMYHYTYVRAGLSSLLKNPDTMNDPDLRELCETWKHQLFRQPDQGRLEALYNKLMSKPVFRANPIFGDLYGAYLKGVHELLTGECYTAHFFDLDE